MSTQSRGLTRTEDIKPIISNDSIFGGLAEQHFGHALTNCLGRLWALDNASVPDDADIFFFARPLRWNREMKHVRSLVRAFGFENRVHIIRFDCRLTRVFTCTDLYSEQHLGLAAPEFLEWVKARLNLKPVLKGTKVYVSRGNLGPNVGRFACEDVLERNLQEAGYQIYYPELHPLEDQFRVFSETEKLIFAEGTPQHIHYLVGQPEQSVAMIQRRLEPSKLITTQLARPSRGYDTYTFNVIKEELWRKSVASNVSLSTLDFRALKRRLVECGFLTKSASWSVPSEASQDKSLHQGLDDGQTLMTAEQRLKWLRQA